jgi:hypothetical protein
MRNDLTQKQQSTNSTLFDEMINCQTKALISQTLFDCNDQQRQPHSALVFTYSLSACLDSKDVDRLARFVTLRISPQKEDSVNSVKMG